MASQPLPISRYNKYNDVSLQDLFASVRYLKNTSATMPKSNRKPFQDLTNLKLTLSTNTENIRDKSHVATKLAIRINELMSIDPGYENYYDIMKQYRSEQRELHKIISNDYMMNIQTNSCLTWNHRRLIIDWLISVQLEYEFSDLTLFTAINYIDCYLSKKKVSDWKSVHALAVAAIYLASKTIEIIPMRLYDCMIISDNVYSHSYITKMEKILLRAIDWNAFIFTPYSFIHSWLNILINHHNNNDNNNRERIINKYVTFISFGIDSFSMCKSSLIMEYFDLVSYLIYLGSFQKEIRDRNQNIDFELLIFMSDNKDLLKKIEENYYKSVNDAMKMVIKPSNKKEEEYTNSIRDKYCLSPKHGDNILRLIENLKIA